VFNAIDLSKLEFPELVSSNTKNDELRFDYVIRSDKVCIHVWPNNKDKVFPSNTPSALKAGLVSMAGYISIIEYVPEVDSWYVELTNLPVKPTDAMLESLLTKILAAQVGNGG
jgi:hypothetical protein